MSEPVLHPPDERGQVLFTCPGCGALRGGGGGGFLCALCGDVFGCGLSDGSAGESGGGVDDVVAAGADVAIAEPEADGIC